MGNLKKQIGFKVKQKFKTEIKNGIDMQKVADKFVNYCHQNNISTLYEVNHSTIQNYLTQENYNPSDKLFVERIFTDKSRSAEQYENLKTAEDGVLLRSKLEKERFLNLYQVNYYDQVTVQNPLGELINFCTKQRIFKTCFAILFR